MASIYGYVRDADTNEPIANVKVSLQAIVSGAPSSTRYTDSSGYYVFPPGSFQCGTNYRITAEKSGYATYSANITTPAFDAVRVRNIYLEKKEAPFPHGIVNVYPRDAETQEALMDATVTFDGIMDGQRIVKSKKPDVSKSVSFYGDPGTSVQVRVSCPGYESWEETRIVPPAGHVEDVYVNLHKKPGPVGTLAGFVRDAETNQPIQGVEIEVDGHVATSQENGRYEIGNIPVGTYLVKVTPPHGYEEPPEPPEVTIQADVVTFLDILLPSRPAPPYDYNQAVERVYQRFGVRPMQQPTILISPRYEEIEGIKYEGLYDPISDTIYIHPDAADKTAVLSHELVHYIIDERVGDVTPTYDEIFATEVDGYYPGIEKVKKALKEYRSTLIDEIFNYMMNNRVGVNEATRAILGVDMVMISEGVSQYGCTVRQILEGNCPPEKPKPEEARYYLDKIVKDYYVRAKEVREYFYIRDRVRGVVLSIRGDKLAELGISGIDVGDVLDLQIDDFDNGGKRYDLVGSDGRKWKYQAPEDPNDRVYVRGDPEKIGSLLGFVPSPSIWIKKQD